MTYAALVDDYKVAESKKKAEQKLLVIETDWGNLQKLLDKKKLSLKAKQKEVEHYMDLFNQFSSWMDNVERNFEEPLVLVGDPLKIANKLHEMKVLYNYITVF